jgi:hypothetical protein
MKEIVLTQNKVALVDDEDYDKVNMYNWQAHRNYRGNSWYAATNIYLTRDNTTTLKMHRFIMNLTDIDPDIDHIDGDGLNNQKSNFRFCSQSQNNMNSKKRLNTSSIYKGVCLFRRTGKWLAYIDKDYVRHHLGYFDNETDAALAYNKAAIELFGEFARLNEIAA